MTSFAKKVKHIVSLFSTCVLMLLASCITSTEDHIRLVEDYLESFIGKSVRDVINSFGTPTKYSNRSDNVPGEINGTYMIYDYRPKNNDCIVSFKYAKKTLKIVDWDYEGNCLLFDGK